jgi:hypothetical protein
MGVSRNLKSRLLPGEASSGMAGSCMCHHTDLGVQAPPACVLCFLYLLSFLLGTCSNCVDALMVHVKLSSIYLGTFSALLRRATTYKHQNKLQEAVDDLRKVLQVEPDNDLAKVRMDNIF